MTSFPKIKKFNKKSCSWAIKIYKLLKLSRTDRYRASPNGPLKIDPRIKV